MKRYYDLIGCDLPLEKWVITYEDLVPTYPMIDKISDMVSATPWPILWDYQIPERLLAEDPGFPILLRNEPEKKLPPWCYRPLLPWSSSASGRYLIRTPAIEHPQRVLFVLSAKVDQNWESLCLNYPGLEHRWIYLGDCQESVPDLAHQISLSEIIYFNDYRPDLLVDLSFGILDTYTLLHLYCLQQGAALWHAISPKDYEIRKRMTMNQAEFLIFD